MNNPVTPSMGMAMDVVFVLLHMNLKMGRMGIFWMDALYASLVLQRNDSNHSMHRLYHHNHGYMYAPVVKNDN